MTRRQISKLTAGDSDEIRSLTDGTEESAHADKLLVERLAAGDAQALGDLYTRYGSVIFRVLKRYATTLSDAEAEDLCQEVFLTAFEVSGKFKGEGTVRSWLCGIAIRMGRNQQRQRWLRGRLLSQFGGQSTGMAREVQDPVEGAVQSKLDIAKALSVLPEAQKEVLLLHVLENMSGEEIAAALGISAKTVWTRLHRARQKMKSALSDDGGRKS